MYAARKSLHSNNCGDIVGPVERDTYITDIFSQRIGIGPKPRCRKQQIHVHK